MIPHQELVEQLAGGDDSLVRAVVQLRPTGKSDAKSSEAPADFKALAQSVLARVAETVGHMAKRTNILGNIDSIILEADPKFLREMIKQPEIVSAMPGNTRESMIIRPVGKRPAED